jgi:pimeloyl-ACP methyl ester carboxylesterase
VDHVWNVRVDALPVDPASDAYVAAISADAAVHPDFGAGLWAGRPIDIPFGVVGPGQATATCWCSRPAAALRSTCGAAAEAHRVVTSRMPRPPHDAHPEATPLPTVRDDDLVRFEAEGPWPLPPAEAEGFVETEGARIWFATFGRGQAVVLLHGGLGNAGNWGYQVPALVRAGYRVVVIDTRGHGRSTWDGRPLGYVQLASDVAAVLRAVGVDRARLVGWSDGAVVALLLVAADPAAVAGVLFFGCNVDASGTLPFEFTPVVGRCLQRHRLDYAEFSATPDRFQEFMDAVTRMQQTQPNLSSADLAAIEVPVTVVHAEHDEFIRAEHAAYLAASLPNAELVLLGGVSHFAPVQRPEVFDGAVAAFLARVSG